MEEFIIKAIAIKNEEDRQFALDLIFLGVKRTLACVLVAFKTKNKLTARDIESFAGLRQPEVSIAIRFFREQGWVSETEIWTGEKGRPEKLHSLQVSIDEIINFFELQKKQEFVKTSEIFQKLKSSV